MTFAYSREGMNDGSLDNHDQQRVTMVATKTSQTEEERLNTLRTYEVLDTPPDGAFDRVTQLAAQLFDVPICVVSLVDQDRIWFKSRFGLDVPEVSRDPGLCASVILDDEPLVLEDALADARSLANPLVAGEIGLRFYAGAPLVTHSGYRLGALAILDLEPRQFDDREVAQLENLAGIVMDQMELRLSARETIQSLKNILSAIEDTPKLKQVATVCGWSNRIKINGEWMSFTEFLTIHLGVAVTQELHPEAIREFIAGIDRENT